MPSIQYDDSDTQNSSPKPSGIKKHFLHVILGIFVILIGGFLWHFVTTPLVVSVSGTGRVSVPAEKARFSVTVSAVEDDPAVSSSQVKSRISAIRQVLVNQGIQSDLVSESQIQITPAGALVSGASGYQAVATLTVETPHVSSVNDLVVQLYQSGASVVSQPVVMVENQDELESEALEEALEEASSNAGELARRKLKFFRRAVSITQASSGQAATSTRQAAPIPGEDEFGVANGTFEVVRAVNVVYEMW